MKKLFAISVLTMMFAACLYAQDRNTRNELKGTWDYTADAAPYEYQKGKLIFVEEEGKLNAKVDIQGYVVRAQDLKIEKEDIEFAVYVDGERVKVNLTLKEGKMEGTAKTYEDQIPLTIVKNKSK